MSNDPSRSPAPSPSPRPVALEQALDRLPDGATLRTVWDALPSADEVAVSVDERHAAWARLQGRLQRPGRVPYTDDADQSLVLIPADTATTVDVPQAPKPRVARIPAWRRPVRIAAAALACIAATLTWREVPVTYAVAKGAVPDVVRLADGTQLTVAAGSRVQVSRALGWPGPLGTRVRDVVLEGEGYFEVAHDGRPFVVHTSDSEVRVLGTRFDVRSPVGDVGSRVSVAEGRVAVRATGGDAVAVLTKGMGTRVAGDRLVPTPMPVVRVGAWRDGGLAAVDEPLAAVFAEIARRFAVDIALDPAVDGHAPVSLFYPTVESLESLLSDLCTAEALTWSRSPQGYRIVRAR